MHTCDTTCISYIVNTHSLPVPRLPTATPLLGRSSKEVRALLDSTWKHSHPSRQALLLQNNKPNHVHMLRKRKHLLIPRSLLLPPHQYMLSNLLLPPHQYMLNNLLLTPHQYMLSNLLLHSHQYWRQSPVLGMMTAGPPLGGCVWGRLPEEVISTVAWSHSLSCRCVTVCFVLSTVYTIGL